jgi:hypothetical protein
MAEQGAIDDQGLGGGRAKAGAEHGKYKEFFIGFHGSSWWRANLAKTGSGHDERVENHNRPGLAKKKAYNVPYDYKSYLLLYISINYYTWPTMLPANMNFNF